MIQVMTFFFLQTSWFLGFFLVEIVEAERESHSISNIDRGSGILNCFNIHIDFQRVVAGQDVHTNVPLHFVNEEKSAAVKAGGIAEHHVTEIEVTCLPKDLPEFIEVDMAAVEMGQTLHLSDLTLPAGVASVELAKDDETHDLAVVTVKPAPKAADTEEGDEEAASEE